jgi:hypothetical protein
VTCRPTQHRPDGHCSRGGWAVLLGSLLVLGASACSTPADSAPPAPPAAVTAIPSGTYQNAFAPSGPQTLTLTAGTNYTQLNTASGQSIPGTVGQDSAQRVTFTSAAGAPCAGQPGLYKATMDSVGLHLTAVADPCSGRASDFAAGPWTRS